jgi:hypothetical protein
LRRRDVIALHALSRDVEQAAVEDVQPHGLWRPHFGRGSSLSGATNPPRSIRQAAPGMPLLIVERHLIDPARVTSRHHRDGRCFVQTVRLSTF